MDSFDDNSWDLLDYSSFIDDVTTSDLYWGDQSAGVQVDVSLSRATSQEEEYRERECPRKRARSDSCSGLGTKACPLFLEPGRPPKADKVAILGDAIRVLNQLRAESLEFRETNDKLLEEIKSLKAEKNELREEKLVLKADKEKMEQQLKAVAVSPAGFLPTPPAAYHAGANKMAIFPSYGFVPMWQYLPPAALDTAQDQALRPPAA
ncbi:basic helix-loop-helix (bHLH) DNA-binding superfamily protein [Actinidia rufa]|uniref:Basic helix-loop-helix (BHLH) DNA-binding superfamily protein n=1 Tax=Actinidia rufa TaxID=165716 RepID=A0A7J0EFJ6_9ERIC|nr:basic helix-loop-helix (bHLH) DNA-binding superfamily protein [Actinidia rufa]